MVPPHMPVLLPMPLSAGISAPLKLQLEAIVLLQKIGALERKALLIDEPEDESLPEITEADRQLLACAAELLARPDDDCRSVDSGVQFLAAIDTGRRLIKAAHARRRWR